MSGLWMTLSVAFLTGVAASMGLGGGFILVIYLVLFTGTGQMLAQGTNLLSFIPIAILSLWIHRKNGLVQKRVLKPAVTSSILGALIGVWATGWIKAEWISKLFAGFILLVGVKEIIASVKEMIQKKREENSETEEIVLFQIEKE